MPGPFGGLLLGDGYSDDDEIVIGNRKGATICCFIIIGIFRAGRLIGPFSPTSPVYSFTGIYIIHFILQTTVTEAPVVGRAT